MVAAVPRLNKDRNESFVMEVIVTYGARLSEAMARRSAALGRKVTRIEVARAAGCSRQNIGVILTNSKPGDQKLSAESHSKVAQFLKVDPDWLLNGDAGTVVASSKVDPLALLTKITVALDKNSLSESQICILSDLVDEFL